MIKLKLAIALSTISTIAFPLALTILPTTASANTAAGCYTDHYNVSADGSTTDGVHLWACLDTVFENNSSTSSDSSKADKSYVDSENSNQNLVISNNNTDSINRDNVSGSVGFSFGF